MKLMKYSAAAAFIMCLILNSSPAHAGFLDKLNQATQKLNQAAQQMEQKSQSAQSGQAQQPAEDPDHPLQLKYKGSCEGHRSATCMDYNEAMDQCMAPLGGYRMKVLGDRIENKLKTETLTDKLRKNLEEDLAGIREAEKNKSEDPTIAGEKKSQRYLSDVSEEDQVYVNAEYGCFHNKIMNKCEGADHMQTGHRTEFSTGKCMTGDEAIAEYRKEHPRRNRGAVSDCLKKVQALRYTLMADMMERKMQKLKLSDKEKGEWQADIAAVRQTAEAGGTSMPKVDDPANPYRPLTRLMAPEEQMQLSAEYSDKSQAMIATCNQR